MTTPPATERDAIEERLRVVRARVDASARRAGRAPGDVALIAVSKTHPAGLVRQAIEAGVRDLGENRVQEAEAKIDELRAAHPAARWHLIGHLQSNKARRAVKLFDLIHTLDGAELVARLEKLCAEENRARLDVLLQIDLGGEESKTGVAEAGVPAVMQAIAGCRHLHLKGLMTVPPYYEDAEQVRPFFARLRELRDAWAARGAFGGDDADAAGCRGELSMGMSHDFEVAIEEGATMIRVGTAIFGARPKTVKTEESD